MIVYVVYEFCGGHEIALNKIFSSEISAAKYIEEQENPDLYHYEQEEVYE